MFPRITKVYKKLSPESKAVLQDLVRETIDIEKTGKPNACRFFLYVLLLDLLIVPRT